MRITNVHAVSNYSDTSLRTINLGDSGFLLCRLQSSADDDGKLKWQVVYEAPHQSHYFNCPFQLGYNNGDSVRCPSLLICYRAFRFCLSNALY